MMRFPRTFSIKNGYISIVLLIVLMAIIVGFSCIVVSEVRMIREDSIQNAVLDAALIGEYCLEPLMAQDRDSARRVMQKLRVIPVITRAILFDGAGEPFVEPCPSAHIDIPNGRSATFEQGSLEVFLPLYSDNQRLGTLYLRTEDNHYKRKVNQYLSTMALLILGLIILAYLLILKVQNIISAPILHLARVCERIAKYGDFSLRVQRKHGDEISLLYERFNSLLEAIQAGNADRLLAGKSVSRSEERLKLALNSANLGLWDWNVQSGEITFNRSWIEALGYEVGKITHQQDFWEQLMHPDDRNRVNRMIEAHFKGVMPAIEVEHRLKTKAGQWRWYVETGKIVEWDSEGKPLRVTGIHRDVTEAKRGEKIQNVIYTISKAANVADNLIDFCESLQSAIAELIYAKNLYIAIYDYDSDMLTFPFFDDEYDERPAPRKLSNGLTEHIICTGQPLLATKSEILEMANGGEIELMGTPATEWLGVPLKIMDKTIGALVVQNYESSTYYGQEEKNILMFVATQVAVVIERKLAAENIKTSLLEKEVLLKEIHHRVKNNMQVISSMLSLQAEYVKDPAALEMFNESKNRVKSMALIHEKLYQSKDLAKVDFAEYITNLAHYLFRTYKSNSNAVTMKIDVSDIKIGMDAAIPCGLIINELVSNSLKYAFPNGKKGIIEISLKPVRDHSVLSICDNGIGLPEDFDMYHSDTLGLQLVTTLTGQLNGDIQCRSGEKKTEFTITFGQLN